MTFIQIIDTFTFYGVDIILLAAATSAVTQLIKITLLKKASKKLVTFLPFILGTLFYAVYAAVRNLSLTYLLDGFTVIVEHGISVGAVSTFCYVLYEQFVREDTGLSVSEKIISTLISSYVPSDRLDEAAKLIAEAVARDVTGNGAKRAEQILTEISGDGISENDIKLLAKLIIETLASLSAR